MKREEAINLLGWLKSKTNRDDDLEAIDMAIEALSTDAVQGWIPVWIPVSERLPNYDGDRYLVTEYCQEKGGVVGISFCYLNGHGFWSDVPKGFQVIAWMPLPKPYREDGEA